MTFGSALTTTTTAFQSVSQFCIPAILHGHNNPRLFWLEPVMVIVVAVMVVAAMVVAVMVAARAAAAAAAAKAAGAEMAGEEGRARPHLDVGSADDAVLQPDLGV